MTVCPACNGDGESDESPLLPCPECLGSGVTGSDDERPVPVNDDPTPEPDDELAAALEAAGLLQSEYPDQMAAASCSCEPEAICGAHRLLARYQQMYDHVTIVHRERREACAEVRRLRADLDAARETATFHDENCVATEQDVLRLTTQRDALRSVVRRHQAGWALMPRADGTEAWRHIGFYPPKWKDATTDEQAVIRDALADQDNDSPAEDGTP